MQEVTELCAELARVGAKLTAENGNLRVIASPGALNPELRQRVSSNKEALLRRLEALAAARPRVAGPRIQPDPASDDSTFPLADLQLGFYMANDPYMEFHVQPHAYAETNFVDLDIKGYETAWNRALARHRREICVLSNDAELRILPEQPTVKFRVYDWRDLERAEVESRLMTLRAEMERSELPLSPWPWFDLRISRWREDGVEHARVHYNHNNFYIDGYGTMKLLAEVDRYRGEPELVIPPLELSYRDAMVGLAQLADSEQGRVAQEYWFSRLSTLPAPPALPLKSGMNRRCRSCLQRRDGRMDKATWDAFKNKASAHGLTPSNAVIAAYGCVIAAWSNSDHFIFSQMVTRRFAELHPDLMQMLGNFASLYPLEIRLMPNAPFSENAHRVQDQVFRDIQHLQFGGMRVLQELNRQRGSFGSAPSPYVVGSGLFMKGYRKGDYSVLETSQTILDHQFFEPPDGSYYYVWDVLEEFFPAGLLDDMQGAFDSLLLSLARSDETWIATDLQLIPERTIQRRREYNLTGSPVPDGLLHDALAERAACSPDKNVLVSSNAALSYGELHAWSGAIAKQLLDAGVRAGQWVPIVMDRGAESLAAMLGVLEASAAYVPIDPRLPSERLNVMLEDVGATIVLTQAPYSQSIQWPATVRALCLPALPAALHVQQSRTRALPNDSAYMIYTSGSTGKPKGVMIDHRGALNTVVDVNRRFGVTAEDRVFGVSALGFDLSVYDIFGTIAAGATVVYPDADSSLDPGHWLDLVQRERVTVWNSVPALMSLLVEEAERRSVSLPAMRLVMLSGDRIPLELPAAIARVAPHAKVVSLGGATEASIWSIFYPIDGIQPDWVTIPYGYPLTNQTWDVRDRNGRPCPDWTPGELYIGGAGLAQGYWKNSEQTNRVFADAPDGQRYYRTGDQGRFRPEGFIEWIGRTDFQVKIQGHRIELGEIESALSSHPALAAAVVTATAAQGSKAPVLIAHIVPCQAAPPIETRELQEFLRRKLPAYMVPSEWRMLEQLPLSGNGKVNRAALQSVCSALRTERAVTRERVAPQSDTEARLRSIWMQVLRLDDVGVTDDFFDIGGQSFDAIRIFARVKEGFGQAFTLSTMWEGRTIRELARKLDSGAEQEPAQSIVRVGRGEQGRPLVLVHPAGGSVMAYAAVGRLINRPLFGIEAGTDADSRFARQDICQLAARYVSELRKKIPHGPYALGGWSSGALISFEMAAALESQGETLEQVFVLDGPSPVAHPNLSDEQLLRWFLQDLALDLPLDALDGKNVSGLDPVQQLIRAKQLLDPGNDATVDLVSLSASYETFRDIVTAGARYQPRTIRAGLTVIRVARDIVEEFARHPYKDSDDWGWGAFTTGPVQCLRVLGTHHTFLSEPIVNGWWQHLCTGRV